MLTGDKTIPKGVSLIYWGSECLSKCTCSSMCNDDLMHRWNSLHAMSLGVIKCCFVLIFVFVPLFCPPSIFLDFSFIATLLIFFIHQLLFYFLIHYHLPYLLFLIFIPYYFSFLFLLSTAIFYYFYLSYLFVGRPSPSFFLQSNSFNPILHSSHASCYDISGRKNDERSGLFLEAASRCFEAR